jgi:hypothetical protein
VDLASYATASSPGRCGLRCGPGVGIADFVRVCPASLLGMPPFLRRHGGKTFGSNRHIH